METLAMLTQAFEEESISHTEVFEWKSSNSQRLKNVRQVNSRAKSMLIICFDIKRIVHKEFILAGETVLHIAVTLYGDCVKICEDYAPKL
jgi:hypothetical protein